jgi:hypothetical protein
MTGLWVGLLDITGGLFLHLHESLAGAFVTLFFNSARLRAQHLTSLASFKQTCEAVRTA